MRKTTASILALSALLSLSIGAIWVMTYTQGIFLATESIQLFIRHGQLHILSRPENRPPPNTPFYINDALMSEVAQALIDDIPQYAEFSGHSWNFAGFQLTIVDGWLASIPLWFLAAFPLCPCFFIAFRYLRRHRRVKEGHCPICNYDLRATPTRCPECGHSPNHVV